jgi:hypothetical protein
VMQATLGIILSLRAGRHVAAIGPP